MRIRAVVLLDVLRLMKPIYRKNHIPAMTWLKLDVEDVSNSMLVTATNGDVWMTTDVAFQTDGDTFTVLVDPRDLAPLLENEDVYGYVTLTLNTTDPAKLDVRADSWQSSIPTYPIDAFPDTPRLSAWSQFHLTNTEWKALWKTALMSVAQDDSRPVLSCVQFEQQGRNVVATGADGFRLTTTNLTQTDQTFDPFLLPRASLKLLPKTARRINVRRSTEQPSYAGLELTTQRTRDSQVLYSDVIMRVNEGTFPDYRQIIPNEEKIVGELSVPLWIIQAATKHKNAILIRFLPAYAEIDLPNKQTVNWTSTAVAFTPKPGYELRHAAFNTTYLSDLAQALGNPSTVTLSMATDHAYRATNGITTAVVMGMVLGNQGETYRKLEPAAEAAD